MKSRKLPMALVAYIALLGALLVLILWVASLSVRELLRLTAWADVVFHNNRSRRAALSHLDGHRPVTIAAAYQRVFEAAVSRPRHQGLAVPSRGDV